MDRILDAVKKCELFSGLLEEELFSAFQCFCSERKLIKKGSIIMMEGLSPVHTGIIVSGKAEASRTYYSGKLDIVSVMSSGDMFGELLASAGSKKSPVTLKASSDLEVVFIEYERLITPCGKLCGFHTKIISNLLRMIAVKYWKLNSRLRYLTAPSLREKVLEFLSDTLAEKGRGTNGFFSLPFDREGMASYLNTDRSALSRELSKMKKDGLIDFNKNMFRLYKY